MQITLEIHDKNFLIAFENLLQQFQISYQTNTTKQKKNRQDFLKKYKPVGVKSNYTPTKTDWYEQAK